MRQDPGPPESVLALDMDGTFIKSALLRGGRMSRELEQVPSRSDGTAAEILGAVRRVFAMAGDFDRVGIAIPGPFDYSNGRCLSDHKFAALKNLDLRAELGVPVYFMHDTNAFLLGESLAGAGRGCRRVGGVTLGTGFGAAFLADGALWTNPLGAPSPEVSLWREAFRDGIVEDYLSARGLLARFPAPDVKTMAEAALRGDRRARRAWLEFGDDLFHVLLPWRERLRPERIVVGGQIAGNLSLLGDPPEGLPLVPSALGVRAALFGAACI